MAKLEKAKHKIRIYLDDGTMFEMRVDNETSARQYAGVITTRGYRHFHGDGVVEWYPVHRINKVSIDGLTRGYAAGNDDELRAWRA